MNKLALLKKLALPLLMITFIITGLALFGHGSSLSEKTTDLKDKTKAVNVENKDFIKTSEEKVKVIPNEFKNAEDLAKKVISVQTALTEITWKNSQYNPSSLETTRYKKLVNQMRLLMIKSTEERFAAQAWATEPSWKMKLLKATKASTSTINVAFAYYTKKNELAQITTVKYDIKSKMFQTPATYRTAIGHNVTVDNQIRNYDEPIKKDIEKGE